MKSGGFGAWNPKFERHFNDCELETVQAFLGLLNNSCINPQQKDKLIWKGNAFKGFTLKAYFNILEGVTSISVPTKILWNPHVPSKIGFFAFEAWWAKVLTSSQLKKRGFHLASVLFAKERKKS